MGLSKELVTVLIDLIENKLSCMGVQDREDMREMVMLQRCLSELRNSTAVEAGVLNAFANIPRRGRKRKVMSAY